MAKSKQPLIIVGGVVAIGAVIGLWYLFGNFTTIKTDRPKLTTLQELIDISSVVVEATAENDGENRVATELSGANQGKNRVSTDYTMATDLQKYPDNDVKLGRFYLSIDGGTKEDKKYVLPGSPKIKKGQKYLVFAVFNKDARLRATAGGYAVAEIAGGKYTLPAGVLPDNKRVFTDADLVAAAKAASANDTYKLNVNKAE